jgi:hypothetical protein
MRLQTSATSNEVVMKHVVHAVAAAVLLAGAGATPALAGSQEPYWPTAGSGAQKSAERVTPGGSVTVTFGGFKPLSTVTIVVRQVSGKKTVQTSLGALTPMSAGAREFTEQADAQGVVTLDVTLEERGVYRVEAEGVDASGAPRMLSTQVVAAPPAAGSSSSAAQPADGDSGLVTALGVGAVLAVAGTGVVVRRRTRAVQAD